MWLRYGASFEQADKLQHHITKAADHQAAQAYAQINNDADPDRRAYVQHNNAVSLSASNRAASLCLTTLPEEPELSLTNAQVSAMVKHRIAAITPANRPLICACDHNVPIRDTQHPHVCVLTRKNAVYARHQAILQALESCARTAGAITSTQPPINLQRGPGERGLLPDLFVNTGVVQYMIDVTVIYPAAASSVAGASRAKLFAASQREDQKRAKYGQLAARNGMVFVPFVMESFGAFGRAATGFLKELVDGSGLLTYFQRRCAIALQRGNAAIAREGIIRLRRRQ
jgi:hypothetical protein